MACNTGINTSDRQGGTMYFNRESYMYCKMFRGDDRNTRDVIEGPPPHLPIYFQIVVEQISSLEYANKMFQEVAPLVQENRPIPDELILQIKESMR